jgi:hypothetical protein
LFERLPSIIQLFSQSVAFLAELLEGLVLLLQHLIQGCIIVPQSIELRCERTYLRIERLRNFILISHKAELRTGLELSQFFLQMLAFVVRGFDSNL